MKKKLFFLYSILFLCSFAQNVAGQRNGIRIPYIIDSAGDIITGLGQEVIDRIPTPSELFQASKQVLFGLPEVAIFETISKLCYLYIASDNIKPRVTPDINTITFRLRTPCKEEIFPLNEAEKILESPKFDVNKKVAIFVTGWMTNSEDDYVSDMAQAYNCRGNYNFLALNTSDSIDTLYTWSAYNTEAVGRILAIGLEKLVREVPADRIQLIGHSLGAHIVGHAGRHFTKLTGLRLKRITGLDPANPCFNEGHDLPGLQRGDADFIDIIHSNPGVLGKPGSVGDIDFYPGGKNPIQPGCVVFGCSHSRSYEYYIESVYPGNENNFLGVRCTSLKDVELGNCKGEKVPMGYAVPYNLKGNYYLPVNRKKPFGRNSNNRNPVPSKCRKCGQ